MTLAGRCDSFVTVSARREEEKKKEEKKNIPQHLSAQTQTYSNS